MKQFKLLLFVLMLALCSAISYGACYDLSGNSTAVFTTSVTLCTGTYNRNASGNSIDLNSNDINFDCNNSILNGNSTANIIFTNNDRVNISNCQVSGGSRGIWSNFADDIVMDNITSSSNSQGIRGAGSNRNTVKNSYFTLDARGLDFTTGSLTAWIYDNELNYTGIAMFIEGNSKNFSIYDNKVYNTTVQFGIALNDVNDSLIYDNQVDESAWNNIDIVGFRNQVYNNTGECTTHYCIDMCDDVGVDNTGYNTIIDNTMSGAGIYICSGHDNNVTQNTITDAAVSGIGNGLGVEGNNTNTNNNIFRDNTLINSADTCIFSAGNTDGTFIDNACQTNCIVKYGSWNTDRNQVDNTVYKDNTCDGGTFTYTPVNGDNTSITINQTAGHIINIANSGIWTDTDTSFEGTLANDSLTRICTSDSQAYTISSGDDWIFNECSASCTFPIDDMTVTTAANNTLCKGTYNIDDAGDSGVLIIKVDDTVLDCNAATLIGTGARGITSNYDDSIIKNCNIDGYTDGLRFASSADGFAYAVNNNITRSTNGINLNSCTGCSIFNSTFYNSSFYFLGSDSGQASGNTCIGVGDEAKGCARTNAADNITIHDNVGQYMGESLYILSSENITCYNNTWSNNDKGALISSSKYVDLVDETFSNNTQNYDYFNTDIKVFQSEQVSITNSVFDSISSTGILVTDSIDTTITDNTFTGILKENRANYAADDKSEPGATAIHVTASYKRSVAGQGLPCDVNISTLKTYNSTGITIGNNTFTNIQMKLINTSGYDLYHDITGVWIRKFQAPADVFEPTVFLIDNDVTQVWLYNPTEGVNYVPNQGYCPESATRDVVNYTINRQQMTFVNNILYNLTLFATGDGISYTVSNVTNNIFTGLTGQTFEIKGDDLYTVAYGSINIANLIVRHFTGYLDELFRYLHVSRVKPTKDMTNVVIKIDLNDIDTKFQNKFGTNDTVNNASIRVIRVNGRGQCVDTFGENTTWCEPIPWTAS